MGININKNIIIATIPSRIEALKTVLDCVYDQCDNIYIVFNNYESIPTEISDGDKITSVLNTSNKDANCARWTYFKHVEGYIASIDDDIIYPEDYMETMISKIDEYDKKVLVTVHGTRIISPFNDYVKNTRIRSHFRTSLPNDVEVPLAGGGTSVFHTDYIKADRDFPLSLSNDIYVSHLALRSSIPIVAIKRTEGWLKPIVGCEEGSIWNRTKQDRKYRLIKTNDVKKLILPFTE